MSQFLYAIRPHEIEGVATLRDQYLVKMIRPGYEVRSSSNGPAGTCSIICSDGSDRCRYDPDAQVWTKSVSGDWWVGYYKSEKLPTEKELRRKTMMEGHKIPLIDGQEWIVPAIRLLNGGSGLPESIQIDDCGKFVTKALSQYERISGAAERLFQDFRIEAGIDPGEMTLEANDRIGLAIDAISLNYCVGIDEVMILSLLTTTNLSSIMSAILDLPSLQKKTAGVS